MDLERMRETRRIMPDWFHIISGDDDLTFEIMTDEQIRAAGVISVISNVAPGGALKEMCDCILKGEINRAREIKGALEPCLAWLRLSVAAINLETRFR